MMKLKTKKRLTNVAQAIFFLLGGIEYAVVLPTLNEYLGSLDGDATFFGIVMAAFSFSGVLTSPLYGLFQDRFHRTKILILFANLFEIAGNFLYFVGGTKYMLLGSRLVSGVGAGVGSSIFAQISRTSTEKGRASALSTASGARQIGLLLGPALNFPLNSLDFYIGPFHVNKFSGPGILMCILYVVLEFVVLFLFYDIPPLDKQDIILAAEENSALSPPSGNVAIVDVFLKEEVLVLLTAQFVFMFNQTCLETAVTVMTKNLLDFGGIENSILFAVAGFELLASFIIIKCISKFISDRTMLFASVTLELVPYIMLMIFYPHATPGRSQNLWWFSILFIIQVSGLGFLLISIVSLFSKVTPPEMQGFAQGVRRAVGGIGTIMGPLWAGGMQNIPFETLAIMMALFLLVWMMSLMSWKLLRPHSEVAAETSQASCKEDSKEETKPLLNGDVKDYGVA
ncbi:major facilitator superfamily domain-containing protein 8-like isoform X2 [Asterias rubens]|uniref:major facilitator superfamily domain-containing protein 8-like isoform X2 n=1 Tax=Asterias rubens TaxID=7604 RepID=UPI0014559A38|nr:major facilitator superfamily domain-containing protein 8-like isoform X2 [Asterias rubens]